jgi:hypothetical protein
MADPAPLRSLAATSRLGLAEEVPLIAGKEMSEMSGKDVSCGERNLAVVHAPCSGRLRSSVDGP